MSEEGREGGRVGGGRRGRVRLDEVGERLRKSLLSDEERMNHSLEV